MERKVHRNEVLSLQRRRNVQGGTRTADRNLTSHLCFPEIGGDEQQNKNLCYGILFRQNAVWRCYPPNLVSRTKRRINFRKLRLPTYWIFHLFLGSLQCYKILCYVPKNSHPDFSSDLSGEEFMLLRACLQRTLNTAVSESDHGQVAVSQS
jgi:hypothetical protein